MKIHWQSIQVHQWRSRQPYNLSPTTRSVFRSAGSIRWFESVSLEANVCLLRQQAQLPELSFKYQEFGGIKITCIKYQSWLDLMNYCHRNAWIGLIIRHESIGSMHRRNFFLNDLHQLTRIPSSFLGAAGSIRWVHPLADTTRSHLQT